MLEFCTIYRFDKDDFNYYKVNKTNMKINEFKDIILRSTWMIILKVIYSIFTVLTNIIVAFVLLCIFNEDFYSELCFLALIISYFYNVYKSRSIIEDKKKLMIQY